MASFKDHLKAEIFAETFSKIFFSGPAGRTVAVFFSVFYALLSTAFGAVRLCIKIVFVFLSAFVSAYRNSRFRIRRVAFRNLKRSVRKFGDRMETRRGNGWTAYEISGIGLRTGEFRIALAHHSKTDATRFFRSGRDGQSEMGVDDVRRLLEEGAPFAKLEDFPLVYRNLRTHVL